MPPQVEAHAAGFADPTHAVVLLAVATIVAIATKFIRLPYTIALVLSGLGIGIFTEAAPESLVSKDLILLIFLPPLLFEGALNMDLDTLRRQGLAVFLLALPFTLAAAFMTAVALRYGLGLEPALALLVGVMVSATDPVTVLAIFKEHGVARGLSIILDGESVFNDGVGVVAYLILMDILAGHEMTLLEEVREFGVVVAGGAAVGFFSGYIAYRLLMRIDDHLTEVMISIVIAYGSYMGAEHLHTSGVIAVVVSGLIMGNYGRVFAMSPTTRITLVAFWDVLVFLLNSALFIMLGVRLEGAHLVENLGGIGLTVAAMLVARCITVYSTGAILKGLGRGLPMAWLHAINWGGLRGSVPIALALGVAASPQIAPEIQQQVVALVFGAVLFSLLVQGLTIKTVLSRLGLIGVTDEKVRAFEEDMGRAMMLKASLRHLEDLRGRGEAPSSVFDTLEARLREQKEEVTQRIGEHFRLHGHLGEAQERRIMRRVLLTQRAALDEAFQKGVVSEEVVHKLKRELDAELDEAD